MDTATALYAFIRHYVKTEKKRGRSHEDIGKDLGVSRVRAFQYEADSEGKVSAKTQEAAAKTLFGGSVDALRAAAVKFVEEHPEALPISSDVVLKTEALLDQALGSMVQESHDPATTKRYREAVSMLKALHRPERLTVETAIELITILASGSAEVNDGSEEDEHLSKGKLR